MPRGKRAAEEPKAPEKEEKQRAAGKQKKDDPKSKDEASKAPSAAPAAPKPPTEEETVERVRVLDRGVRESRQNINNCVELVQILREVRRRSLCSLLCAASALNAHTHLHSLLLCATQQAPAAAPRPARFLTTPSTVSVRHGGLPRREGAATHLPLLQGRDLTHSGLAAYVSSLALTDLCLM